MAKTTAAAYITQNQDRIRLLTDAGDLKAILSTAKAAGFNSAAGFTAFKKGLKTVLKFDYNAVRNDRVASYVSKLGERSCGLITLYSDASVAHNRFSICNQDGDEVWYGNFFNAPEHQAEAELEAAKKAIWLAGKVKPTDEASISLKLFVDAEWLCWANLAFDTESISHGDKRGGKALKLAQAAKAAKVFLEVDHISGDENPADRATRSRGWMKWQDGIKLIKFQLVK